MGIHARSRHRELNTLTCLVMKLEGWKTTVELQNDAYVSGLVIEVDAKMNMQMKDAWYTDGNGRTIRLDLFHVRGRKIRYVHIPDKMDMMEAIRERVAPLVRHRKVGKKSHIALKRTEQTVRRFYRQQEGEHHQQPQQGEAGPSGHQTLLH
ncbi:hypothetical protein Pcinc_019097 [Petrolisthes cinctipes]|uniref:Sm domain-containing protein n=1 Tax=Petrolisthes cinctipes TaxID=88211 RepID=A0AAE1KN38_PETCI|nr:hypothetical protein Pcinc_019097 [Petrolisthes cinctipes]